MAASLLTSLLPQGAELLVGFDASDDFLLGEKLNIAGLIGITIGKVNQARLGTIGHHVEGVAIGNLFLVDFARVFSLVASLLEPLGEVSRVLVLGGLFLLVVVVAIVGLRSGDFLGTGIDFHGVIKDELL